MPRSGKERAKNDPQPVRAPSGKKRKATKSPKRALAANETVQPQSQPDKVKFVPTVREVITAKTTIPRADEPERIKTLRTTRQYPNTGSKNKPYDNWGLLREAMYKGVLEDDLLDRPWTYFTDFVARPVGGRRKPKQDKYIELDKVLCNLQKRLNSRRPFSLPPIGRLGSDAPRGRPVNQPGGLSANQRRASEPPKVMHPRPALDPLPFVRPSADGEDYTVEEVILANLPGEVSGRARQLRESGHAHHHKPPLGSWSLLGDARDKRVLNGVLGEPWQKWAVWMKKDGQSSDLKTRNLALGQAEPGSTIPRRGRSNERSVSRSRASSMSPSNRSNISASQAAQTVTTDDAALKLVSAVSSSSRPVWTVKQVIDAKVPPGDIVTEEIRKVQRSVGFKRMGIPGISDQQLSQALGQGLLKPDVLWRSLVTLMQKGGPGAVQLRKDISKL